MNAKKLLGLAITLLSLLIPLRYSVLSPDEVSNMMGLSMFLLLLVGLFVGYFLIDSADAQKGPGEH